MGTYLDAIVDRHREAALADGRDPAEMIEMARGATSAGPLVPRPFVPRLLQAKAAAGGGPAVIAEIKRASPSKGPLAPHLGPAALAGSYESGGAAAISVLTDEYFFSGSASDLTTARSAVGIPLLRKDFTVCALDIADARLMGADAVLLIVDVLDDTELAELSALAASLQMAPLVEVHDLTGARRAMAAGATLIGVNQRDLHSFKVDPDRAIRLAGEISGAVLVAESGITSAGQVARLADAGYDAVLVGEHLVRSADPARAVAALSSARAEVCS
ncbi:MAG: indole-3-glycerol phosphate synthase TrpC [Acidimicrobiales bacterium]